MAAEESGLRLASGAFDPHGDYYSIALLTGFAGSQLMRVDISTGIATPIGSTGDALLLGMEFDDKDNLFSIRHVSPLCE